MDPSAISSQCNVKTCSLCPGNTEYYCYICDQDLCLQCKEEHVINLDTLHHNVTVYRGKYTNAFQLEKCVSHQSEYYNGYCETCEVPVCEACSDHIPRRIPLLDCFLSYRNSRHRVIDIKSAYKKKWNQHQELFFNIRSNILYERSIMMEEINAETFNNCETIHRKIDLCQKAIVINGHKLNDFIDAVLRMRVSIKVYQHRYIGQMLIMTRHITMAKKYENRYVENVHKPVQFLRFVKTTNFPQIRDTPHLSQHQFFLPTGEVNLFDLTELLSEIQITERGQRQVENDHLLMIMPSPVLQRSLRLTEVKNCFQMSCVASYCVWFSDEKKKLILKDTTTDEKLHIITDSRNKSSGSHTVNTNGDIIYVDRHYNIKTLSSDLKKGRTFIKSNYKFGNWKPLSVSCSPSSGDVYVGMYSDSIVFMSDHTDRDNSIGKLCRYSTTGQIKQTIFRCRVPSENTDSILYGFPQYIIENTNGDIVVSDSGKHAVVVTDNVGNLRYSYTGHPSSSRLLPKGICTDPLSNILVCVENEVQIIDRDGQFLSCLLTNPTEISEPQCLNYDVNCHLLWVGSAQNNIISTYKYVTRHPVLFGKSISDLNHGQLPYRINVFSGCGFFCVSTLYWGMPC